MNAHSYTLYTHYTARGVNWKNKKKIEKLEKNKGYISSYRVMGKVTKNQLKLEFGCIKF